MKLTRKIFALVMALTMVLGLAISASADSITINGAISGATYNGYQILNLSAGLKVEGCHANESDHDANCYNLAYSVNPKYADILEAVTGKTTNAEILAYISAMTKDSDEIRTFADTVYAKIKAAGLAADMTTTSGVFADSQQGYWLIEEIMPSGAGEADHSLVVLTTMGIRDITVNTKRDNVVLEKEIYHDDAASWTIVGDDQIGDTVHFHTTSYVPDTDGFDAFFYVIHDTMSEGLTSNVQDLNANGDVKVTINAVDGAVLADTYYKVYTKDHVGEIILGTYVDTNGVTQTKKLTCTDCDFHVVFDIKAALDAGIIDDDDVLYTAYSAVLNENATVYQAPGDRENNQARVEYSNNPYDESETTETPDDEVYEYTFQLGVTKTDATTGTEITGAKFVLSKDGSKMGNTIDANGNAQIDGTEATDNGLIAFIYDSVNDTYKIAPAGYTGTTTYVIEAGSPTIHGLDDGTDYYLYEIKAPAGYNAKYTPTRIKLFVEYDSEGKLKEGFPKVQIDSKEQSSVLELTIENNTGTIMPSTGGIGTTLFYIFGGLMFLGASVLLITKKRMAV